MAKSRYQALRDNQVSLTANERKQVLDAKAIWHHGPHGEPTPAVWKSRHPRTGAITYVTNTHRAMATAPTLKGAIRKYHDFIKSTA